MTASGTSVPAGTPLGVSFSSLLFELLPAMGFGDLNGETCATQSLFGDGLACAPGTCVFDTSGCSVTRYEDTGLGSVIDHQTGLEWQKTDDAGGLTDKDNLYEWSLGAGCEL